LFLLEDATSARHLFHEAGTCAMGAGADAPCDPWGRLRAIDNIWVADASVFPSAGDGHPTLTVLAHALRVARSVQRRLAAGSSSTLTMTVRIACGVRRYLLV
jgi:choline dehydrogenase-like flavoprotein